MNGQWWRLGDKSGRIRFRGWEEPLLEDGARGRGLIKG